MPLAIQNKPGHYCATSHILVNAKDGSVLVHVPAGVFEMGDGENSGAPTNRVELSGYWIGVNCVTNRQYEGFVKATGPRKPETADFGTPIWKNGTYPVDKADHPVVCVSWDDAESYVKWAGCQLPTEAQWEKAAKGPLGLKYPWGKYWDQNLCRNEGIAERLTTAAVSEYPKGVGGYGTYQQSGNVWEWCQDLYEEGHYGKSPAKDPGGPASASARAIRGESWDGAGAGNFRAGVRSWSDPGRRIGYLGFRIVRAG